MICAHCNRPNATGMEYCDFCGTPLGAAKRRTVAEGGAPEPAAPQKKRVTVAESGGDAPGQAAGPPVGAPASRKQATTFDSGQAAPPPSAPSAAPVTGRRVIGWLVTFDGYPDGLSFILREGRNTIGRDATCDVALPGDPMVSASHAFLIWRSGRARIADNSSMCGTFLNEEDVLGTIEVEDNDVIRVGRTRLLLRLLDAQKVAALWSTPAGT